MRTIEIDGTIYIFKVETKSYDEICDVCSINVYSLDDEGEIYLGAFEDGSRDIFAERVPDTIPMFKVENTYYSTRKLEYVGDEGIKAAKNLLNSLSYERLANSVKSYLL